MRAFAALPLCCLAFACTARNSGYEKQLKGLEENVAILKSERDRLEERIAVLESERDVAGSFPTEPMLERPQLQVVAVAPPPRDGGGEAPPSEAHSAADSASVDPIPVAQAGSTASSAGRPLLYGSGTELHQSQVPGAE